MNGSGYRRLFGSVAAAAIVCGSLITNALAQTPPAAPAPARTGPPNILVIFGDDVGQSNISAYTFGVR
jgi:hypothetical protein